MVEQAGVQRAKELCRTTVPKEITHACRLARAAFDAEQQKGVRVMDAKDVPPWEKWCEMRDTLEKKDARIAELEAIVEGLTTERDMWKRETYGARSRGVHEGIERVRREQPHYSEEMPDVWQACNRARDAFDAEQQKEREEVTP